jgi:hypothetical protein
MAEHYKSQLIEVLIVMHSKWTSGDKNKIGKQQ